MKRLLAAIITLALALLGGTALAGSGLDLELPADSGGSIVWLMDAEPEGVVSVLDGIMEDGGDDAAQGAIQYYRFEGLRPGETPVTLRYAPAFDTEDVLRTITLRLTVDEALNVLATSIRQSGDLIAGPAAPQGLVCRLDLYITSDSAPLWLHMEPDEDGTLWAWRGQERVMEADAEFMETLDYILYAYDVAEWNGFHRSAGEGILDGQTFSLEILWENGFALNAYGDNAFPPDYGDVVSELEILFGLDED